MKLSLTSVHRQLPFAAVTVVLLGTGCATVKASRIRPDYDLVDRQQTKRLVVVVEPAPEGNAKVGDLWSVIARRYVNQKRQFIAKESRALSVPGGFDPKSQCGEGIEGVLWILPHIEKRGEGFEEQAKGLLIRCTDGQEVWYAEAGGSWPSVDPHLKEVTANYVTEMGADVEPYVAPAMNILRPMLDTLPDPVLNEQDKDEKVLAD